MKNLSFILLLISSIFLASCSTVKVSTDYDRSVNFATFKTYSYHQKGLEKLSINDLDKKRIISAIDAQMATKGFTKVANNADLVINILASSSETITLDNDPFFYGWGYSRPYYNEYTTLYGKIIIDIVDDKNNILVWQGIGSDLNITDISVKAELIPKAITQILANFPPQPQIK